MKIKISLFVLFCLFTGRELMAQEFNITGTWTMFEMTRIRGDEVFKTTEDQLINEGVTSEYSFLPDGTFKLIGNMSDSRNLDTLEGTWTMEGDKLTCSFKFNENPVAIPYDFEFRDKYIHLKQTFPDGSTSVVNSYKRK